MNLFGEGGLTGHEGHDIHPRLLGKQLAHDLQLLFTALLIDLLFSTFQREAAWLYEALKVENF